MPRGTNIYSKLEVLNSKNNIQITGENKKQGKITSGNKIFFQYN